MTYAAVFNAATHTTEMQYYGILAWFQTKIIIIHSLLRPDS